jgi:hypothetical protein
MAWMTAEAAVAVTAGVLASSIALVGFGLDSVIEFFAAAVVVWQLRGAEEQEEGEHRDMRAVRLIGVTFFALALYPGRGQDLPRRPHRARSPRPGPRSGGGGGCPGDRARRPGQRLTRSRLAG